MRKIKRQIKSLATNTMYASGAAIGITALGGSAKPVANVMKFAPAMGTMIGAGGLIRSIDMIQPRKKRRRR